MHGPSLFHPRGGGRVSLLSVLLFGFLGRDNPVIMVGGRLVLIPVIAAVGYEVLRLGARHRGNPLVKVLMYPGILVQMITTKQPTEDMIEVAIVSLEQAIAADGDPIPEGGLELSRDPMPLPGETAKEVRAAQEATDGEAASPAVVDPPLPG